MVPSAPRPAAAWLLAVIPLLGCTSQLTLGGRTVGGGPASAAGPGGVGGPASGGGPGEQASDGPRADRPEPLSDAELLVVEPASGVDRAVHRPGRIAWCAPGPWTGAEVWDRGRLRRAIHSNDGSREFHPGTTWADGLGQICQWADDPSWQRQATYVIQMVMNLERVGQDEAVVRLREYVAANQQHRAR